MSEAAAMQSKPIAMRGNSSDQQVLAQVEKWMAMIRELSRELQAETKLSGGEARRSSRHVRARAERR
jgi:hypothetical protein